MKYYHIVETPAGPACIKPEWLIAVGPAIALTDLGGELQQAFLRDEFRDKRVRKLYFHGGESLWMLDTPENMATVLEQDQRAAGVEPLDVALKRPFSDD